MVMAESAKLKMGRKKIKCPSGPKKKSGSHEAFSFATSMRGK